ncbi:MAG: hypothetical protein IPN62_14555 [Flavobacteriales bacterium]|nr:hypothetical protein [Flavobacteriales bacterium]
MPGSAGTCHAPVGGLSFRLLHTPVGEFAETGCVDAICFDAFSPAVQPEMWTPDVFRRMFEALRPGGRLDLLRQGRGTAGHAFRWIYGEAPHRTRQATDVPLNDP